MNIIPLVFMDFPQILDCTVTPIPAFNAPALQVIATTGVHTGVAIEFNDSTGDFIGVYVGAMGQEILLCIIGNGLASKGRGKIPAQSRISLRSMTNSPVTVGQLSLVVVIT